MEHSQPVGACDGGAGVETHAESDKCPPGGVEARSVAVRNAVHVDEREVGAISVGRRPADQQVSGFEIAVREAAIGEIADERGECGEEAIFHSALFAAGARRHVVDEEGLEIDGILDQLGDQNTVGAKEAGGASFDDGKGLSSREIAIEEHIGAAPGAEISRRPDRVEELLPQRAREGLLADDGKRIGSVELRAADNGAVRVLQYLV